MDVPSSMLPARARRQDQGARNGLEKRWQPHRSADADRIAAVPVVGRHVGRPAGSGRHAEAGGRQLSREAAAAVRRPEIRERFVRSSGIEPVGNDIGGIQRQFRARPSREMGESDQEPPTSKSQLNGGTQPLLRPECAPAIRRPHRLE